MKTARLELAVIILFKKIFLQEFNNAGILEFEKLKENNILH
jgi:hypothetical protein